MYIVGLFKVFQHLYKINVGVIVGKNEVTLDTRC